MRQDRKKKLMKDLVQLVMIKIIKTKNLMKKMKIMKILIKMKKAKLGLYKLIKQMIKIHSNYNSSRYKSNLIWNHNQVMPLKLKNNI